MSNLWACGLVVVVGWLSFRATEPKEQAPATPLVVSAGAWSERQDPKPPAVTVAEEADKNNVTNDQRAAGLIPAVLPASIDPVARPAPEMPLPALENPLSAPVEAPTLAMPSEPMKREPDPSDPPPLPPDVPRAAPTAPSDDLGPMLPVDPPSSPSPKVREEGIPIHEVKPPSSTEPSDSNPTLWRPVPRAAGPAKEAAPEPPLPANHDTDAPPSTKTETIEDPETPSQPPSAKPIPLWERAPLPTDHSNEKVKKEPIAATPVPRLVPKPMEYTAATLGAPHVITSAETSAAEPCRLYGSGEYLFWFTKAGRAPPLVTTGPASSNGILGRPGTVVLIGGPGTRLNDDVRQGGRVSLGYWLDPCQECAVEGSFFFLGDSTTRFQASSDAFPLLARPFFRINTASEFSQIAARSDLAGGNIHIESPTRLWGAELNARHNLCSDCNYRVDVLLGVRYLDLKDSLHITEDLTEAPTVPVFANDHIVVADRFDTHNRFFGSQAGVDTEWRRGRFIFDFRGKLALGDNHETLDILGSQTITTPQGNVQTFRGGLLALPSNMGHFTRDRFAVVPEVGLSVGHQVTSQLRVSVGYNLLWWSNVLRAGNQIDRVLDETQIPNFGATHLPARQNRPAVLFKETDYWAQGIMFSVEYRY